MDHRSTSSERGQENRSYLRRTLVAVAFAASVTAPVMVAQAQDSQSMEISRSDSRPSASGPAENFTGAVRVDMLFDAKAPARTGAAIVTFEPGARTAWHKHPLGQRLVVLSGFGRTQVEGGPVEEIRPGDVIWCPPNVRHWHGASPTTAMSHIAIQESLNGSPVTWMEKVTDQQYRAGERQ